MLGWCFNTVVVTVYLIWCNPLPTLGYNSPRINMDNNLEPNTRHLVEEFTTCEPEFVWLCKIFMSFGYLSVKSRRACCACTYIFSFCKISLSIYTNIRIYRKRIEVGCEVTLCTIRKTYLWACYTLLRIWKLPLVWVEGFSLCILNSILYFGQIRYDLLLPYIHCAIFSIWIGKFNSE